MIEAKEQNDRTVKKLVLGERVRLKIPTGQFHIATNIITVEITTVEDDNAKGVIVALEETAKSFATEAEYLGREVMFTKTCVLNSRR